MKKYLVKINGKAYEVEVDEIRPEAARNQVVKEIAEKKATPAVNTTNAVTTANAANTADTAKGIKVTAPMPGTILKVNVAVGDQVNKGQVLLILEAMKMENEIVSPANGRIASANVSKGSSVNSGDLLISIV